MSNSNAEGKVWRVGQPAPNAFLTPPFDVTEMDGDNNGSPAEVHTIDMTRYGYCYEPK